MRGILLTLGLLLLFAVGGFAQEPPVVCEGTTYKEVTKGEIVPVCFEFPDEDRPLVKYFRVRRSQTPAGAYLNFMTLVPSTTSFQFMATMSCHIFLTTVWDETQEDGSVITRESPGSNHIQIVVK